MTFPNPSFFSGSVVHQRINPIRHRLKYWVFSALIDLDDFEGFEKKNIFFSHNNWNVLSVFNKDYADGKQADLAIYCREEFGKKFPDLEVDRVMLLTYPRVWGYAFNPLSVFIGLDKLGSPIAVIYEVNNTFSGRTHYVCRISDYQVDQVDKDMLVSPFNGVEGHYDFRLKTEQESVTIGVALRVNEQAIMNSYYRCENIGNSNWAIAKLVAKKPLMTFKVMAAIHYEALKLWLKGLRPPKTRKSIQNKPLPQSGEVHSTILDQ